MKAFHGMGGADPGITREGDMDLLLRRNMPPSFESTLSAALRRQLQMLGALAREQLMEVHFRYAMELVDHSQRDLDPSRALSIYNRLHGVTGVEAEALFHKTFVALGRRSMPKVGAPTAEESQPGTPQSIIAQIRRRLRGRTNLELRKWVEYHTGRAETELLWTHVENALQFIDLLEPVLGAGDAVALYAEEMGLSPNRSEVIYYLSLAHRSAVMVPSRAGETVTAEHGSRGYTDLGYRSLKIVANRRRAPQHQAG